MLGSTAESNDLTRNFIGTNPEGAQLGNGAAGVLVTEGAHDTVIGRLSTLSGVNGNVIRFNGTQGIRVDGGANNAIVSNAISRNGLLGIDLGPLGVTPNDAGDADTGANNLQNFPVLTSASGGVQGTLNSTPNSTFRIEFFGNTACDASGNGEGATLLGNTTVTTDDAGNATIALFSTAADESVTATATDSSNNTLGVLGVRAAGARLGDHHRRDRRGGLGARPEHRHVHRRQVGRDDARARRAHHGRRHGQQQPRLFGQQRGASRFRDRRTFRHPHSDRSDLDHADDHADLQSGSRRPRDGHLHRRAVLGHREYCRRSVGHHRRDRRGRSRNRAERRDLRRHAWRRRHP